MTTTDVGEEGWGYLAEQQRALWQAVQQESTALQQKYAVMELATKKQHNERNVQAARRAVEQILAQEVPPGDPVARQKQRAQVAAQRATIERQLLENLEMAERAGRHEADGQAALKAAQDFRAKAASLEAAHGPLTESLYLDMQSYLNRPEAEE